MTRWMLAACLLVAAAPARAADARFEVYAAGINIIDVEAKLDIAPERYRVSLDYRTVGAVGWMMRGRQGFVAEGRFAGDAVVPERFSSSGTLRGDPRRTEIAYRAGQPTVRQLVPPNEAEREPVEAARTADTVDTLSAMAGLLHRVATTGRCDGRAATFDGRRLSVLEARTGGMQALEPTGRSSFAGQALRCDFVGRQTGGFMLGEDRARLERPQTGTAWFAPVAGAMLPVRVAFRTRWFGEATMYLVAGDPANRPQ